MSSFSKFTFYYLVPLAMGFSSGLIIRDHHTISIKKKLSMCLADYYQSIEEEPSEVIDKEYPEVSRLIRRVQIRENK